MNYLALILLSVFTSVFSAELDSTFGNGGIVSETENVQDKIISTNMIQTRENKLLYVEEKTITSAIEGSLEVYLVRRNQDGSIDKSFGTRVNGRVFVERTDSMNPNRPEALLQQPDGKILLLSSFCRETSCGFIIRRFSEGGSLDSDYGNLGAVSLSSSTSAEYGGLMSMSLHNGKITLAIAKGLKLTIFRFLENGNTDSPFGINGKLTANLYKELQTQLPMKQICSTPIVKVDEVGGVKVAFELLYDTDSRNKSVTSIGLYESEANQSVGKINISLPEEYNYRLGHNLQFQGDGKILAFRANYRVTFERFEMKSGKLVKDITLGNTGNVPTMAFENSELVLMADLLPLTNGFMALASAEIKDQELTNPVKHFQYAVKYTNDGMIDRSFGENGAYRLPKIQGCTAWDLMGISKASKTTIRLNCWMGGYHLMRILN